MASQAYHASLALAKTAGSGSQAFADLMNLDRKALKSLGRQILANASQENRDLYIFHYGKAFDQGWSLLVEIAAVSA